MVLSLNKLFVCDYLEPKSNQVECLIIDAESEIKAEEKAIAELKTLNIPKRYLLNIEEVL